MRMPDGFATVDAAMADCCARFADRTALHDGRTAQTYAQLAAAIDAWAMLLRGHVGGGGRLAISAPNSLAYLGALFGALRCRAVPFLVDPSLTDAESAALCADNGITHILLPRGDRRALAGARRLASSGDLVLYQLAAAGGAGRATLADTVLCRFTTGTQGQPKCLEFSHRAVLAAATTWAGANRFDQDDVVFCLAGFFNGLAFNTSLLATFLCGATLRVYAGWLAPSIVMRAVVAARATRLVGFPVFYRALADSEGIAADAMATIRQCICASSRLDPAVRELLAARFGLHIMDYYGVAETGPVTFDPGPAPSGQGLALPGVAIRIDAAGTLWIRTPSMASRYLNHPGLLEARIDADGYYRSGDRATWEGGRLHLGGRSDGVIEVHGKKFDPDDVEIALRAIPLVRASFVFARATGRGPEIVAALETDTTFDKATLQALLAPHLAPFKMPDRFLCVPALPRNGAGKVLRAQVERLLGTSLHFM